MKCPFLMLPTLSCPPQQVLFMLWFVTCWVPASVFSHSAISPSCGAQNLYMLPVASCHSFLPLCAPPLFATQQKIPAGKQVVPLFFPLQSPLPPLTGIAPPHSGQHDIIKLLCKMGSSRQRLSFRAQGSFHYPYGSEHGENWSGNGWENKHRQSNFLPHPKKLMLWGSPNIFCCFVYLSLPFVVIWKTACSYVQALLIKENLTQGCVANKPHCNKI